MTLALDSANNLGQFTTSVKILFQMNEVLPDDVLIVGASSAMALIMLFATAILLGLVTWIGQVMEEEIART